MSDPWDGPGRQATRSGAQVPGQRPAGSDAVRPRGGRTASGAAPGSRGDSGTRRPLPVRRGRRVLKILGISLSALILVTSGVGWWFYEHLNGNIHSVSLDGK
ncbi:LytR family transcriptional regulator, partial [Streptomyces broussonetiae]